MIGACPPSTRGVASCARGGQALRVQTQAQVKAVLEDEAVVEGETETLPIELDAIPGAVWQMELHALMPAEVRVSLFERGARKCALLRFPQGSAKQAYRAFESALRTANQVSQEVHSAAHSARQARERAESAS
jgi:hypothetical protein